MIQEVVRYLHDNGVAFRLSSHPSPERRPAVAHALPPGGKLVETFIVLVAGRPAIACVPEGTRVNIARLGADLGASVTEGAVSDLPNVWSQVEGFLPPLGGLIGVPLFVDQSLAQAGTLTFRALSPSDYIDLSFDDFARLERPRFSEVAMAGTLPEPAPTPAP